MEITKKIYSEISAGELFDKISILEIKKNKIKDKNKRNIILKELSSLHETASENIEKSKSIIKLYKKLKSINKNSIIFFADINSSNKKISEKVKNSKNYEFYLLIGPEGDFSLKEREILNSMKNCIPFSLGQNILRSETAAVVGLTLLNSEIN